MDSSEGIPIEGDERLDLVNAKDEIVGSKLRSEIYREGLRNFRVVNAFVQNRRGELWIPRRARTKVLSPNALDCSVAGHVRSGESYVEAFRRELWEELRIQPDEVPYRLVQRLLPWRDNVSVFMHVYCIALDETPPYDPNEFSESFWLTPLALLSLANQGELVREDLPKLVERFFKSGRVEELHNTAEGLHSHLRK